VLVKHGERILLLLAIISYSFLLSLSFSLDSFERFIIDNGDDIVIGPKNRKSFTEEELRRMEAMECVKIIMPRIGMHTDIGVVRNEGVVKLAPRFCIVGLDPNRDCFFRLIEVEEGSVSLHEGNCIISRRTANHYKLKIGDQIIIYRDNTTYKLIIIGTYRFKYKRIWELLSGYLTPLNVIIISLSDAQRILKIKGCNLVSVKLESKNLWIPQFYTHLLSITEELKEKFNAWRNTTKYHGTRSLIGNLYLIRIYYGGLATLIIVYIYTAKKLIKRLHYIAISIIAGTILGIVLYPLISNLMLGTVMPLAINEVRLACTILAPLILASILTIMMGRRK